MYEKIGQRGSVDWDDLRLFLSVAREGGLAPAARASGCSAATLGRRMLDLERQTGRDLFQRHERGYDLTLQGRELLEQLQSVEAQLLRLTVPPWPPESPWSNSPLERGSRMPCWTGWTPSRGEVRAQSPMYGFAFCLRSKHSVSRDARSRSVCAINAQVMTRWSGASCPAWTLRLMRDRTRRIDGSALSLKHPRPNGCRAWSATMRSAKSARRAAAWIWRLPDRE